MWAPPPAHAVTSALCISAKLNGPLKMRATGTCKAGKEIQITRIHRRHQIMDAARGAPRVSVVTAKVGCHLAVVYDWVHRFNASWFSTFELPSNPRGRMPIITDDQLRELVDVALSSPRERGLPFSSVKLEQH